MSYGQFAWVRPPRWAFFLAWIGLLLGLVWLYAPALHFGLIWDDPQWFGRIVNKSWLDLIWPSPTFQFYRPGTMLYNRLFWGSAGPLQIVALHWLQIAWHVMNVTAVFAISRKMGFPTWPAYAAALLFGVHPFAHQAVAWAAPQQPLVLVLQNAAWLLYLHGRAPAGFAPRRRWTWPVSLLFFATALTVQEGTAPFGLLPLLFELTLRARTMPPAALLASLRRPLRQGWLRPFAYLILSAAFMLIWWLVPRAPGITRVGFEGETLAFFLQGFVYPAAWLGRNLALPTNGWLAVFLLLLAALWGVGVWRGRGALVTAGLAWGILGLTPAIFGLPFSYVQLSQRLLYYAAPGVAWLWVGAFWPAATGRRWVGLGGLAILATVALGSSGQVRAFHALYQPGVAHLQEMTNLLAGDNGRALFINFPDRYAPKEPPYPLGYWGVTLAPVVVELGDFPALLTGATPTTRSRAMPAIDQDARAAGPYLVDMRGVMAQPEEIYGLAAEGDQVVVSRYGADGRFWLQPAGSLQPQAAGLCGLATFGETICLHEVQIREDDTAWHVRLTWSAAAVPEPFATVFLHVGQVGQPPLAQADGDAWRGALPLRYWQPGDLIIDIRTVEKLATSATDLALHIGVYDSLSGARLPAMDPAGRPLPGDAYSLPLPP